MLDISQIKIGSTIEYNDEPYQVVRRDHHKMGRGGAVLKTKLKNLATGQTLEKTFGPADRLPAADLTHSRATYLYPEDSNYLFMDTQTYEQFSLSAEQLGSKAKFLAENTEVQILNFKNQPVNIELPTKITLKITSAPPGVRGDTAQGATKEVETEAGLRLSVPLFIKEGDQIIVDTRDGQYVERAK